MCIVGIESWSKLFCSCTVKGYLWQSLGSMRLSVGSGRFSGLVTWENQVGGKNRGLVGQVSQVGE